MNAIEDIEHAIVKVRDLLAPVKPGVQGARDRAPRENVIKHWYRELERLRRRAGEYEAALNEEVEGVHDHLEILNKQLRKLMM